jgi:hypothetical protein
VGRVAIDPSAFFIFGDSATLLATARTGSCTEPGRCPSLWLNPRQDTKKLAKLLRSYPSAGMLAYRVSTLVNNPKNDVVRCIELIR